MNKGYKIFSVTNENQRVVYRLRINELSRTRYSKDKKFRQKRGD